MLTEFNSLYFYYIFSSKSCFHLYLNLSSQYPYKLNILDIYYFHLMKRETDSEGISIFYEQTIYTLWRVWGVRNKVRDATQEK